MNVISPRLGAVAALLAICLQMVVGAVGGRICLRMPALPAQQGCQSECCDREATPVSQISASRASANLPLGPADGDCCLEPNREYLAQPTAHPALEDVLFAAPLPVAAIVSEADVALLSCRVPLPPELASHPPRDQPIVRTTVLLI